jgi:hypothetical protein
MIQQFNTYLTSEHIVKMTMFLNVNFYFIYNSFFYNVFHFIYNSSYTYLS